MPNRSLHFKLFWTALIGAVVVMALLLGSIAYIAYGSSVRETAALVDTIVKANAKEVEVELGVGFTVAESLASAATALRQQQAERKTADAVTRQLLEAKGQ
jgi:methyl-accepting chemotaxis protein